MNESEVVNEYWESLKNLPHNQNKNLKVSHRKIIWCSVKPIECDGRNCNCKLK
jgi:hypothetical protein